LAKKVNVLIKFKHFGLIKRRGFAMTIIKTTNITKSFGKLTALNGVNMEVNKGEVYGFIGPNGSGKSTTIRILLGILKASEGEAKIFGKDAWRDAVEVHKRIAYVPGDVNLWPNLTGGEVIDLFMKLRGDTNQKLREELIQKFNLDPSKKCRAYSKGNRQKVALVTAFSSDAELYILDEPTSGLDPLMEKVFQECVLDAKREGKSVLLSSHILSEVEKLCDRVGIIRRGEIIETGTLSELRHLTRTKLLVETKQPLTALHEIKGIHDIEEKDQAFAFQVDSEALDTVMQHVSQFGLVKLESSPPTLENLFMRHYEEKTSNTGVGGES
jgi:ABC-2 type transport system ATP-binding protein